jgi:zinc/manganese transport system substrate-binding protein
MKITFTLALLALCLVQPRQVQAKNEISIVAAENFYGDIAGQIGGGHVTVTSILKNPDQDPHLFEASPSVARALSGAQVVIYSGIDYDPWMEKLLGAAQKADRQTIVVADLAHRQVGDNPHIWYDPKIMLALAAALADDLQKIDPPHRADYQQNLVNFQTSLQPIVDKIATLHDRLAGTPVTATEPVFGYMFDALGMEVRNKSFQLAVMNDTEPSASDVAAFENDLNTGAVRLLVYNSQASDPIAVHMEKRARASHVPVVGVTETEPAGKDYQTWMKGVLDAVDGALPDKPQPGKS